LLHKLNEESLWHSALWSLQVSCPGAPAPEVSHDDFGKHHIYIVFTRPGLEHLVDQLEEMRGSPSWNPRARFLVIVTGTRSRSAHLVAQGIAEELWNSYKIMDVLLLIPETGNSSLGLYTWIPYQSNIKCTEIEVFLIDTWLVEGNGRFLHQELLFPVKIPKEFHGCPVNVTPVDTPPLFVLIRNNTDQQVIYTGMEVEIFQFFARAINVTAIYQYAPPGDRIEIHFKALVDLHTGATDITFGGFPLHPFIHPFGDFTISYFDQVMKWYVPCGTPVPRMEKVMKIFTPSVWVAIGFVSALAAIVMWLLSKCCSSAEPDTFRHISDCFYAVWAVTLGVSVPQMPRNSTMRAMFLFLVCYCFAIGTLFQTIFTSILVNPGFGKQITTLEELNQSNLFHCTDHASEYLLNNADPTYYEQIRLRKKDSGKQECIFQYFSRRDIVTVYSHLHSEHFALAGQPVGRPALRVCTLDDDIYKLYFSMYLKKGSPLLGPFNDVIRRLTETGVKDKLLRDIKTSWRHENSTANEMRIDPVYMHSETVDYFVFSMSHLKLAFYVLVVGYFLSFVFFVGELLRFSA
jgi:hypothetical protein